MMAKLSPNKGPAEMIRSKTEKELLVDIHEIEELVTCRHRPPEMKPAAQWERNALLSADRNDLIRLGVGKAFSEMEFFMEGVIANYFIKGKKHSSEAKKRQLFESALNRMSFSGKRMLLGEIVRLPLTVSRFLVEVERLKENSSHHLSEMESGAGSSYRGRSIFNLAAFKHFYRDAEKASGYLTNQFIRTFP